jgi:hypothetical protein
MLVFVLWVVKAAITCNGIWKSFPLFPGSLTEVMTEQESCNQYADISAVLVEESHRQLLVPSCIHESGHDPPLPEDQGNSYHQYLHPDLFCALDCSE